MRGGNAVVQARVRIARLEARQYVVLFWWRIVSMAINGVIWLTAQDYNPLRHVLAELTRQSRGMQAGVDTLEEILDVEILERLITYASV
jgi:hypothetical protein